MPGSGPDEAAVTVAGRALAAHAGVSLDAGLEAPLRQALAAAAAERGGSPADLAAAAAGGDEAALALLCEHALVGETSFWRQAEGLTALAAELAGRPGPLRLWSAGCATGEEPYSLAMALLEAGRAGRGDAILATDLSARALARAAEGRYAPRALRRLPSDMAARWLEPDGDQARVVGPVRAPVTFARHNLLGAPPPGPFDAVCCRNVLIYFEPGAAEAALGRLTGALAPGGLLLLGPVELSLARASRLAWLERGGATLLCRD